MPLHSYDAEFHKFERGFLRSDTLIEDPTLLTFRLLVDFSANSPLLNTGEDGPSAYRYLHNIGQPQKAELLKRFRDQLDFLSRENVHAFQSVEGLREVAKFDPTSAKRVRGGGELLTFKLLEMLDLRVTSMLDLYVKAVYDVEHQRTLLPENLRWFHCYLLVSEVRQFHQVAARAADGTLTFEPLRGLLSTLTFEFDQCELDTSEIHPFLETLTVNPEELAAQEFKLKVGKLRERHEYPLLDLITDDRELGRRAEPGTAFDRSAGDKRGGGLRQRVANFLTAEAQDLQREATQALAARQARLETQLRGELVSALRDPLEDLKSTINSTLLGNVYELNPVTRVLNGLGIPVSSQTSLDRQATDPLAFPVPAGDVDRSSAVAPAQVTPLTVATPAPAPTVVGNATQTPRAPVEVQGSLELNPAAAPSVQGNVDQTPRALTTATGQVDRSSAVAPAQVDGQVAQARRELPDVAGQVDRSSAVAPTTVTGEADRTSAVATPAIRPLPPADPRTVDQTPSPLDPVPAPTNLPRPDLQRLPYFDRPPSFAELRANQGRLDQTPRELPDVAGQVDRSSATTPSRVSGSVDQTSAVPPAQISGSVDRSSTAPPPQVTGTIDLGSAATPAPQVTGTVDRSSAATPPQPGGTVDLGTPTPTPSVEGEVDVTPQRDGDPVPREDAPARPRTGDPDPQPGRVELRNARNPVKREQDRQFPKPPSDSVS